MLIMKNLVANILWPLPGSDGQTSGSTAIQCNGEFEQLQQIRGNLSLIFSNYAQCTIYYMHYALCSPHYALCTTHYALCSMHYILRTIAHNFNPWSPALIWLKVTRPPSSCNLGNSGCIRFTNSSMTFILANSSDGLFKGKLIERNTTTSMDDHLVIYSKSLTIQKLYQKHQVYVVEWFHIKENCNVWPAEKVRQGRAHANIGCFCFAISGNAQACKILPLDPNILRLAAHLWSFCTFLGFVKHEDDKQVSLGWTMR